MLNPSINQLFDLSGKVALVTGGSRGIGFGIVARLAEAGAQVMISSITPGSAARAAAQIREAGWQAEGIQSDASDASNARADVHSTVERFGRLDILVNNAGIFPVSPLAKTDEELWDRVMDTNLKGAFFTSQAAAQQMIAQGQGGRIINIGSVDSFRPTYAMAHYSTSKGGMIMLTKSMAVELGVHGITVNMIAPGFIYTDGVQKASAEFGALFGMQGEESQKAFVGRLPIQRAGEPDDIGKAALFLASDAAPYITGATLPVDGGVLIV